jgi:periplasmic protein TonB
MALPERRPRRLGPVLTASLALHLSILVLLLLAIQRRPQHAEQVPPADFAMVFEGHSPQVNSGPNPEVNKPSGPGSPAPGVTVLPVPPTPPAPATPPAASASPPAAPAAPPVVAILPPAPPAPAAQPSAEAHPAPAPPETKLPLPPPVPAPGALAMAIPRPPPVPAIRAPETPRTPSNASPRPERRPERAPAFPTPLAFSFGLPGATASNNPTSRSTPPPPRAPTRIERPGQPGMIDLSFGPIRGGSLSPSASTQMEGVAVSTDWLNLVAAWWQRHGYYPPQAAENFEDGDVTLHMKVDPDGRVEGLELTGKSGSQWLDLAALSVFRDATLPPLPSDMPATPIPFEVTVHYVLIGPTGVHLRR